MTDLIAFGETMLRLSPPAPQRLEDTATLQVHVGGAESNVAANLARLGKQTSWFSRLPASPLGHTVRNAIRHHGVDTSHIIWADDERLGLYFAEFGAEPRGVQVWYDRARSAASALSPADLPLDAIAEAGWLHLSGITPALSESCADAVATAIDHAASAGTKVSFDVNYRARLWSAADAARQLDPLCSQADLVFVARRDAVNLWSAPAEAAACSQHLQARWGGTVIVSDGGSGVTATDGTETIFVPSIEVEIVDRVGAGDALASGVLHQLISGDDLKGALEFGVVLAGFALSVPGDIAMVTLPEIEAYLEAGGGQLRR